MDQNRFYLYVDKDVDLNDFVEVFHVSQYEEPEVGYSELNYDPAVDSKFYKHLHIVEYICGAKVNDIAYMVFKVDDDYIAVPAKDYEDDLESFLENRGLEVFLNDYWYTKEDALCEVESYIDSIAKEKAEAYINDPWSKYDC